jgi:aryl-alcohol dehydrogenase-like predicted oxidoreductase
MEFRYLGESGLKVSEIIYGNWLTHGSQVENDTATACVRAALEAGVTTFDTADAYANGAAETVLGKALKDQRRESLEILTKVYWPTGPKGPNDVGLSRNTSWKVFPRISAPAGHGVRRPLPGAPVRQ